MEQGSWNRGVKWEVEVKRGTREEIWGETTKIKSHLRGSMKT